MSENFNSHIACEGTDNDINWVCKVCKDLPNYAGMYLYQREREKNQLKNVKDRCADLILMKYYYALLHLLDKIHELHECPNPENDVPKYADRKCSIPECFVYYRYIYNTYASILMTEKGLNQINLRCDICSVLPYTIFSDLEMIAKNMHSDDMEKTQKLEIEAVIADYYLEAVGFCEQWDECPSGVDWLELIKSVQLLRKYLEKKDRKELQISLNEWNRVRSIDNILNTEIKTTCRDFQTKNIPLCVLEKKTLVYMDFGVYQLYESNEVFHTQLYNYAEMDEIQFVYSPTHMEEVCRMDNSIFEGKRRDNISKICSNCEVLPVRDGCLKILTEPVEVCFDRAKKLQVLNQYAEESECATFETLEEKTCGLLRWDEKEVETHRKEISTSKVRNEMIIDDVITCVARKQTPVILTRFKEHAKFLHDALKEKADHVFLLYGDNSDKENAEIRVKLKQIPENESLILVATGQKIGEGFDFPRLDVLMLAAPVSFEGRLEQYVGRLNRDYVGKEAVYVYDYIDSHVRYFDKMYAKRLRTYRKMGFSIWTQELQPKQIINAIFDSVNYTEKFEQDIVESEKMVVISSPDIRQDKIDRFLLLVKKRQEVGVKVTVITTDPEDITYGKSDVCYELIRTMQLVGINVITRTEVEECFAVIDDEIVWHGGMNLLGKADVWDNLMRIRNSQVATELLEIALGCSEERRKSE